MIELRPYQKDCLNAAWKLWRQGVRRMLVALPTGTGKTVIFSQLPKAFQGRYLVIAHRKELLDQSAQKLQEANPGLGVDIEQAERAASSNADIVVGSVQTLSVSPQRLERLTPESFGTVVIDEAHHVMARTYCQLLARLGLAPDIEGLTSFKARSLKAMRLFKDHHLASEGPVLLGFTATPHRTDKLGLEYIFDEMAYSRTMAEMMAEGWLCPITGWRIETALDLSGVKKKAGEYGEDYEEKALAAAVNTPQRNAQAVKAYQDYCPGQQTIVFCVDIQHTHDMLAVFEKAGIAAAAITGLTPQLRRDMILSQYKAGQIKVLVNCMVLTEGFDAPETACIIMCRPTQSQLLYTQMLGRGTRPAPDKEQLTVLDLVDVTAVGVCSLNTLFGLPPDYNLDGEDVRKASEALEQQKVLKFKEPRTAPNIGQTDEIDPLAERQIQTMPGAHLLWVRTQYGWAMGLPDRQYIGVVVNLLGHAIVKSQLRLEQPTVIGKYMSECEAAKAAEEWLAEKFPDIGALKRPDARWRGQAPTEKQLELCRRLRITVPAGATKGDVSNLIDQRIAEKRVFA